MKQWYTVCWVEFALRTEFLIKWDWIESIYILSVPLFMIINHLGNVFKVV